MGKNVLFLACRSVKNSFFEISGPCPGAPNMAFKGKKTEIWLPDLDFFQGLEMERKPPQQCSVIYGDVLDPPATQNIKENFW